MQKDQQQHDDALPDARSVHMRRLPGLLFQNAHIQIGEYIKERIFAEADSRRHFEGTITLLAMRTFAGINKMKRAAKKGTSEFMFDINSRDIATIIAFMKFCKQILQETHHKLPEQLEQAVTQLNYISQGCTDQRKTKGWQKKIGLCVQFLNSYLPAFNYKQCIWTSLHLLLQDNISMMGDLNPYSAVNLIRKN